MGSFLGISKQKYKFHPHNQSLFYHTSLQLKYDSKSHSCSLIYKHEYVKELSNKILLIHFLFWFKQHKVIPNLKNLILKFLKAVLYVHLD